jgi:hypothetical protein
MNKLRPRNCSYLRQTVVEHCRPIHSSNPTRKRGKDASN